MHAFLVIGNSTEAVSEKIGNMINNLSAVKLDFLIQKIADVRDLRSLTKISFGQKTAIILKNFNLATEEAQSAFLKELEEPQKNIFYILTANSIEGILPTIISRVQFLETGNAVFEVGEEERRETIEFIRSGAGERLSKTSKIKDRQEAIEFIDSILIIGHEMLIKNEIDVKFLEEAAKTLENLKANGNVQLQLTNFIVNISKNQISKLE